MVKFVFTKAKVPISMKPIMLVVLVFFGCTSSDNKKNEQDANQSNIREKYSGRDIKNISYGTYPSQIMDLYFPEKNNNGITIIYIHGGAWYSGDKSESLNWARFFQSIGYTFISINYRLSHSAEQNIYPVQIDDVRKAIDYIKVHADEWGIDAKNFAIMGASAGAQLCLLYAYNDNDERNVKVAIALCGISDLTDTGIVKADIGEISGQTMLEWYLGKDAVNNPDLLRKASPVNYINENSIPTFLIHGKLDQVVSYVQSLNVAKKLSEFKIPNQLNVLEGIDHDLLAVDLTPQLKKADTFVQSILKSNK